eukprot:TRINITY_DN19333_c0_g1_i1.p1 TRINITY_DN19333_c0_g1~~TRINITY_DN19333_c0_g1_i1.p1  ORF type:complete len:489 (-),score=67.40 TRINITY_DN19333_c0_g1_i1:943-2409(-)
MAPGSRYSVVFDKPAFSDRIISWRGTEPRRWPTSFTAIPDGSESCVSDAEALLDEGRDERLEGDEESVESGRAFVSRAVLAAASPYFEKLFTCGMRESRNDGVEEIALALAPEECQYMRTFLLFCYCDEFPDTSASLSDAALLTLVGLANHFEVPLCIARCCEQMASRRLDLTASVEVLNMADTLQHHDCFLSLLDGPCIADGLWCLESFSREAAFMELSAGGMAEYLRRKSLIVDSEQSLFEVVLRWADRCYPHFEGRQSALLSVVPFVRFPAMDADFLQRVVAARAELQSLEGMRLVIEALAFKASPPHVQKDILLTFSDGHRSDRRTVEWFAERFARKPSVQVVSLPDDIDPSDYNLPGNHYLVVRFKKDELEALEDNGKIVSKWVLIGEIYFALEVSRQQSYFQWILLARAQDVESHDPFRPIKAMLRAKNQISAPQNYLLSVSSCVESDIHFPDFWLGSRLDMLHSKQLFDNGTMVVVANLQI